MPADSAGSSRGTEPVNKHETRGSRVYRSRIGSFLMTHWEREDEGRAAAHLALHPDLAAMELDELPGEGQPEPGAFRFLVGSAYLPKFLEHRLLIRRRDADAGVRHGHLCDMIGSAGPGRRSARLRG